MFLKTLLLLAILFFGLPSTVKAQLEIKELVFWNFWDESLIMPVIERFEKLNPGVKIHNKQINWNNGLEVIIVALANGRAPDICEFGSSWMGRFMSEGALIDLSNWVDNVQSDYLMHETATYKGRTYGVPWLAGTRVLFYNRNLFKKAGLDPDAPPVTWQQMLDASEKIHNSGSDVYGFGINAGEAHILYKKFMPFVWSAGGKIYQNGKFVFNSSYTRKAIDFHRQIMQYSYIEKQDQLDEAFMLGKLGMTISGSWNFARYPSEAPNLDFSVAMIPEPDNNSGFSASFLGGQVLGLFNNCRHPEIAAEFLKFITKPENTLPITKKTFVSFPAHLDAYSDDFFSSSDMQIFVKQLYNSIHPPVHRLWIEMERIINYTIENALYGGDADLLLKRADERFANAKNRLQQTTQRQQNSMQAHLLSGSSVNIILLITASLTLINSIFSIYLFFELKKKEN